MEQKEWWKVKSIQYVGVATAGATVMSEEIESTPKVNCGVWTAIENYINKENNEKIWDIKNVPPKVVVTRKKEKLRSRKYLAPVITTLVQEGRNSGTPSRRSSERGTSDQGANAIANAFAHKALVIRTTRNEHAEEVFERSKRLLENCNVSVIDCSFNLPRVNAQLEKLMGSNVVHLTDRKYMTELRRRITEDFENMLMKRIQHRKQEEIERQMKLVLHGLYNPRNVPKKLISAHSVVLAEEIQRQRILLMEGKLLKCPKELRNHPVLIMNESTNNFVIKRRAKLKTERERVSERMIRLGKKWEAEHILWEEKERQNEVEMKIREMELLKADQSYVEKLESVESRKVLEKCFRKNEMNMTDFLAKERVLMLNRLKPKEKKFVPFTKDLRIVDAKRRMSEASISKLKSIVAKVRTSEASGTLESEQSDDTPRGMDEVGQAESDTASQASTKSKKTKGKGLFSFFKSKSAKEKKMITSTISREESPEKTKSVTSDDDIENVPARDVYVDPVIVQLKSAKNVKELYNVAEKIVGVNIEKILDKSKSGEAEEAAA